MVHENFGLLLSGDSKRKHSTNIHGTRMHFSYRKRHSSKKPCKKVLLFLPGNPGVPEFYSLFLDEIHKNSLGMEMDIFCLSYIEHVFSVDELLIRVLGFVDLLVESYSPKVDFIIAGHSFGAYLTTQILNRRPELPVVKILSLFPAMMEMEKTPRGQVVAPITTVIPRTILSFLAGLCSILPKTIWQGIAHNLLGFPLHISHVISEHVLVKQHALSALYLGNSEMQAIKELQVNVLKKHAKIWICYFGKGDGWCPDDHIDEICKIEGLTGIQCVEDHNHAFVLYSSIPMARKVLEWIESH